MIAPTTGVLGSVRLKNGSKCSLELEPHVSELRYRRLFETAQDGILILDGVDGRIIDPNPFLLDLLDYPFTSIIGLQLWEIGLSEDIAANKAAFTRLQTEEYIRYENHPLRTKSGKVVAVEFVSNVYFVGRERVIQCNIRDISERTACQTASDLRVAALETAGKAKDELIAALSRELTGGPEADPEEELWDSIPGSGRWDPVPGSTGQQTLDSLGEDEDNEGSSESAQLVEEGIKEAEDDQMLQGSRAEQEKD